MGSHVRQDWNPWVDLNASMAWLPEPPYLVAEDQLTPTVETLESLGFQLVTMDAGVLGGDLEESLLIELSSQLAFSPLGAGNWAAYSDRLWDLLTAADKQPVAIVIEHFDHVLRADFHAAIRIIHVLLSMTEDLGLKTESRADRQVEYFFIGSWPS